MGTAKRSLFGLLALLAFAAGFAPWFVPDDLRVEVVNQRPVLLGRYGLARFAWMAFLITPLCWTAALFFWARRTRSHRYVLVRMTGIGFALLAALVVADLTGRVLRKQAQLENTTIETATWPTARVGETPPTRPPSVRYQIRVEDVPPTARSYPDAPAGHPPAAVALSTDAKGYRNAHAPAQCDVVVLGEDFTEGTGVDDADGWPARLAAAMGEPVYNLGLAGAGLDEQLEALLTTGLPLAPKVVVVMVSERDAFVALERLPAGIELVEPVTPTLGSLPRAVRDHVRSSPVTQGLRQALIDWCAPVRAKEAIADWAPLAWMPVQLRQGDRTRAYAFTPRDLVAHHTPREAFEASPAWLHPRAVLATMASACRGKGARLIVTLAPGKARILLPLVEDTIPTDGLHLFAACAEGTRLPAPEVFRAELLARLDDREQVLETWCRAAGLAFVSVTEALRARTRMGEQVYWTYRPHWTAAGHALVARRILGALQR